MSTKKCGSFDVNFNTSTGKNLTTEEKITIQSTMSDITKMESIIQNLSDPKNNDNNDSYSNRILKILYSKMHNLEQKKIEINKILLLNTTKEKKEIQIKETVINELENKIIELKYKINEFNTINFNPMISKKILENNQILSKDEINDILNNLKEKESKDFEQVKFLKSEIQINENLENNINDNLTNLNSQIEIINEKLGMLKEEKSTVKNEIINLISCKETMEALIKFNFYLIKNFNEILNNDSIDEFDDDDGELYNKNKWNEPIKIYLYEIQTLNIEKISKSLLDNIFELFNIINEKNENNSLLHIIKNEFQNLLTNNKDINNFLDEIAQFIMNEIISITKNKLIKNNYKENLKNVSIYISYYIKSSYYDNIIKLQTKFLNHDCKFVKKNLKANLETLKMERAKFQIQKNETNMQQQYNKQKIQIIQNEYTKNFNENSNKLSKEEENYIQLCSQVNNLNNQKEELKDLCNKCKNNIKNLENKYEDDVKDINYDIKKIENEIVEIKDKEENKKIENNNRIEEYRKNITEKYETIKDLLKNHQNKYKNNLTFSDKLKKDNSCNRVKEIYNYNSSRMSYKDKNLLNYLKSGTNNVKNANKMRLSYGELKSKNNTIKTKEKNDTNNKKNKRLKRSSWDNHPKNKLREEIYSYLNNKNQNKNIFINHNNNNDFFKNNDIKKNQFQCFLDNENCFSLRFSKPINIISSSIENNTNNFIYHQNPLIYNSRNNLFRSFGNNFYQNNNLVVGKYIDNSTNLFKSQKNEINPQLSNTIILLKEKIASNNNECYNSLISKISELTKITFCYFCKRNFNENTNINFLTNNIDGKRLCEPPYNFIRSSIAMNKSYDGLRIVPSTLLEPLDFCIEDIENTVVSSKIKKIVEIYRNFRKFGKYMEKSEFINKEKNEYKDMSEEEIEKCLDYKYFGFDLIANSQKLEFVMSSYDDFKMWINGLAFIIKNKKELIEFVKDLKK